MYFLESNIVWSEQNSNKMSVSVYIRVNELGLVIHKDRHCVIFVEVHNTGLACFTYTGATSKHLHVIQPKNDFFRLEQFTK